MTYLVDACRPTHSLPKPTTSTKRPGLTSTSGPFNMGCSTSATNLWGDLDASRIKKNKEQKGRGGATQTEKAATLYRS